MNKSFKARSLVYNIYSVISGGLIVATLLAGGVLASGAVRADGDSVVDEVQVTVDTGCTMGGTVNTAHTTSLTAGTYSGVNGIGKTTLTTYCNDYNGFSIYAIGYTGDVDGGNNLVGASSGETINTGVYSSGASTSSWSMKVTKVTDGTVAYNPENMSITNSYDSYHVVPSDYAKVAEYKASAGSSTTDTTLGAKVETTYDTYISTTQTADNYTGQVKYVMVHPYNASAPEKETPTPPSSFSWQESSATKPADADVTATFQSFDSATCNLGTTGQVGWLKDSRDGTVYTIGKLADGKCWLLDNLALDLTNSTVLNAMTADNTNASATSLDYLKNGGGTTSDQYATAGVANWTSGASYSAPLVNLTNKDTVPSDAISQAGSYKIGGYYNYCAASAGSYCYGDGTSYGASSGNATEDICPKGWRMPAGNTTGEYSALANAIYGSTGSTSDATAYANYRLALHIPLSGYSYNGSANGRGSDGRWWSSTRPNNSSMYTLYADTSDIKPVIVSNRNYGSSVRCILGS